MRVKYIEKKASELKQGDEVQTWGGTVTVKTATPYRHTTPTGHQNRVAVVTEEGDTWDVAHAATYSCVAPYKKREPYFKYTMLEMVLFNVFTFTATSMIWIVYINKWFGVTIPIMQ
jgi:hypothetical protein